MNCAKAAKRISEYTDGVLGAGKSVRLERHLESCPACRELLRDIQAIAKNVRRLDAPNVPAPTWTKIRARLQDGGAVPIREKRLGFATWVVVPWHFAVAAAALILIIITAGVYFFNLRQRKDLVVSGSAHQEQRTLAKLDEAERYYELAVKSLSEALAGEKSRLSPELAEIFERNLEVVDTTIQFCRQAVQSEPDNVQVREYLLAAYKKRVALMNDLLDMSRKSIPKEDLGQVLY